MCLPFELLDQIYSPLFISELDSFSSAMRDGAPHVGHHSSVYYPYLELN